MPCVPGAFCAGGADLLPCDAGSWDDDSDPATPCVPRTDCMPGQFVRDDGDAETDRTCTNCPDGTSSAQPNATTCVASVECFVENPANAGSPDAACLELWVRQFGSEEGVFATAITPDDNGNVYVVGDTTGALPEQTSQGNADAFIRKYDTEGTEVWTRQFGTSENDYALGARVDLTPRVNIVGLTLGAFPGNMQQGGEDAFLHRYDLEGQMPSTSQFGSPDDDFAAAIDVDRSSDPVTRGSFYVAGLLGAFNSDQDADVFAETYYSFGFPQSRRRLTRPCPDRANALSVDASGNLYLAGEFGCQQPPTGAGEYNAFVQKLTSGGSQLWLREFGTGDQGNARDEATSIALDASGAVYVVGYVGGALPGQTSQGDADAFIRKYDSQGTELWTRQFGTAGEDKALAVAVDAGDIFVAGYVTGGLPGHSGLGEADGFVRGYDSEGNLLTTLQFGTSDEDHCTSLTIDSAGDLFITGHTLGTFPEQVSSGTYDAFVAKIARPAATSQQTF